MKSIFFAVLMSVFLSACSSLTGEQRTASIRKLASESGWAAHIVITPQYDLQTFYSNLSSTRGVMTVYIEGDGHAWVGGRFPADDPTPFEPIGLKLAMAQPTGLAVYLGRPCQYVGAQSDARCDPTVWTDARFSLAAIAAMNQAINEIKQKFNAKNIRLVGFSGGAAIALWVAAKRQDVFQIMTVAGNLDPMAWAQALRLQPLMGSVDTRDTIAATAHIPQVNFVGGKDQIVPKFISEVFVAMYPKHQRPKIVNIINNTHTCCWVQQWPSLWSQYAVEPRLN
jgi:poly(3-hydroxybutyrate) depolymerase